MIWVIGKNGLLGRELCDYFDENGILYVSSGHDEADICDEKNLIKFAEQSMYFSFSKNMPIKWIINCAAYTNVIGAENYPDDANRVNRDGAANVAKLANLLSAKFIHISTDYVFSGKKITPYTEMDSCQPTSKYGQSKLAGEFRVNVFNDKNFIIRTSWLYGSNGCNFVTQILHLLKTSDTVKAVSDKFGSPTYALDLVKAIYRIIDFDSTEYGTYHFSNTGEPSRYELADRIRRFAEREGIITPGQSVVEPIKVMDKIRPDYSCLDCYKVKETFGISIDYWVDALERYFPDMKKILNS